jgi:hypothetical protein
MENMESAKTHIREDVTYPATAAEIVAACNNMEGEVTDSERQELEAKLNGKTYNSAQEVFMALGW